MKIDKVIDKRIKEISEYCDITYFKGLDYIRLVLNEMYYRGRIDAVKKFSAKLPDTKWK